MTRLLLAERDGAKLVAALLVDGELAALWVDPLDAPSVQGATLAVRVKRVERDGLYVECGLPGGGFVDRKDVPAHLQVHEGLAALAQVLRDPLDEKGAKLRLTGPAPASQTVPAVVRAATAADRLTALAQGAPVLAWPPALAADLRHGGLAADLAKEPVLAAHGVNDRIAELLDPVVTLPSGARLILTPTPALVAVDVDRGASREPAAAINRAAATRLAAERRLRGLAGLIVVDFLKVPKAERDGPVAALRQALAGDAARHKLLPMSDLGLVELSRERLGRPLAACWR